MYPQIQEAESLLSVRREALFESGDCDHDGQREVAGYRRNCRALRETAALFGGSGTAADEVMISSRIPGMESF
jgi:hypothetical protein